MSENAIGISQEFLAKVISELGLKSACLVQDRDGFYLLLVNGSNKAKEVRFGESDKTQTQDKILSEITELVSSQGW